MELLQLSYFMRAAESLNFTKAAKSEFTSQSNVSKQVARLEKELGIKLFERRTTGVGLTSAGEHLYSGLIELEAKFTSLITQVKEISRNNAGSLKIGFSDGMDFNRIIPKVFEEIAENEHSLNIEIFSYPISKVMEKLLLRKIDIAISYNLVDINIENITRYPLSRTKSLIYYSKRNPLYLKKDLTLLDFKDEVFYLLHNPIRKKDFNPLLYLPFTPKQIVVLDTVNEIILNIERGRGITVFGKSHYFSSKDSIATFTLDIDNLIVGADAIWLNDNKNPKLGVFLNYLHRHFVSNRMESSL